MSFEEFNTALIDPWKIKTKLLARAGRELPHRVGQSFTDVIDACLRFKDLTEDLGEFATHQLYENKILTKLNKAMRE